MASVVTSSARWPWRRMRPVGPVVSFFMARTANGAAWGKRRNRTRTIDAPAQNAKRTHSRRKDGGFSERTDSGGFPASFTGLRGDILRQTRKSRLKRPLPASME
jgi:hypothetical protein